ncbi:BLUF domain-containing protein [Fretibacter rubidus]|uniref:BLUF domain-containing protein n=1 Tax=Fretibacter rubidus TaxID=570162 RepID=UPI00352AB69A
MTHRIIYSSEAADNVTDADFRMIAMFSRMNNRRNNIAGLLLHYDGHIMQVLEGPRDAVKALYAKIDVDKRHKNVKLLMDEGCDKPIFSEWSMGFRPMESLEQMDAFFELSKNTLDAAIPEAANEDVRRVVGDFAKNAGLS